MKYYEINYENGAYRHGEFNSYTEADDYAQNNNGGYDYTISEYDSYEDYINAE